MKDYQNPALFPEMRARSLLAEMTLDEKLAQINIIRGVEYTVNSSKYFTCTAEDDDHFDFDKVRASIGKNGIGYIHDIYSFPRIKNEIQKYLVEETRLGIPCIFTGEALHGLSFAGCSIFPVPLTLSQTFDPELVRQVGDGIARETRSLGHHEILAPNLDVARDPRWGRTEETFGEDTYLSSEMAAAIISGEQKGDISRKDAIISEPKHYCVHGIAEGGLNCAPARVGVREVETCYLPVFEAGIKRGGAYNVMACYNSIDGEPVLTSEHYLKEVLKDRIGLRGISRADWGAINRLVDAHHLTRSRKEAIRMALSGGLDMQGCCDVAPEEYYRDIKELLAEGKLNERDIDESVFRILKMKFELGLFEHPYTDEEDYAKIVRCEKHQIVMKKAAEEAIVLLQNNGVLPLSAPKKLAVIGPSSAKQQLGGYSSNPRGYEIASVYEEIVKRFPDAEIRQCDGCGITKSNGETTHYVDGQPHLMKTLDADIDDMIEDAAKLASGCDAAILVCGDNNVTSGEGSDRSRLVLNGRQRELILRVAATGTPVILVLENGKAIELSAETKVCAAIVVAGFGGEYGARAIVRAVAGDINPAGRLSVSYPRDEGMIPCYYSRNPGGSPNYLEGSTAPLFPFGHGLSYTKFAYSGLTARELGNASFEVSFTVKNEGDREGDEVVQLYINDIDSSIVTPGRLLRRFRRITLAPGEEKKLTFVLGFDDLKLLDKRMKWVVEPGDFDIMVGASSADIRLNTVVTVR